MTEFLVWVLFAGSVQGLAADDYLVREASQERLARWSYLTLALCERTAAAHPDPEARRRALEVATEYQRFLPAYVFDFFGGTYAARSCTSFGSTIFAYSCDPDDPIPEGWVCEGVYPRTAGWAIRSREEARRPVRQLASILFRLGVPRTAVVYLLGRR